MTSLARRLAPNPRLRAEAELPATAGEGVAASLGLPTMGRLLGSAERRAGANIAPEAFPGQPMAFDPETGRVERFDPRTGGFTVPERLSVEQLNERYGQLGLSFDAPMTEEAAAILADGKRAEIIRNDIMARAPGGVAT